MGHFLTEELTFLGGQLLDTLEFAWSLGDQCALLQLGKDIIQVVRLSVLLHVSKQPILWDPSQGVFKPRVC